MRPRHQEQRQGDGQKDDAGDAGDQCSGAGTTALAFEGLGKRALLVRAGYASLREYVDVELQRIAAGERAATN